MNSWSFGSGIAATLVAHLWQSTAMVLVAWLMTAAMRESPARTRFFIWLTAYLKFLIPFALLTRLGARWAPPTRHVEMQRVVYTVMEVFNEPFARGTGIAGAWRQSSGEHLRLSGLSWLAILWACGFVVMIVRWALQWARARRVVRDARAACLGREIRALERAQEIVGLRRAMPVLLTPAAIEPGIFGILRPVLLWPEHLSPQLDDLQIETILIHELEHVRRRDNLVSALQALVEAVFWFHPAVYWMRSRMSEERERACDERVMEHSGHPEKYAQGILAVCAFCLEPPLACVAGVSGSDLKKRVLRIMSQHSVVGLSIGRKATLAMAALLVIMLPVGFGVVRGQSGARPDGTSSDTANNLPKYEVASIKPSVSSDAKSGMSRMLLMPDGMKIEGVPLQMVLRVAFGVEDDRLVGLPSWARSSRYDMEAKVSADDAPRFEKLKGEERNAMLLPVLEERMGLKYHHETRELPVYNLIIARGGAKLTESKSPPLPLIPGSSKPTDPKEPMAGGRMMMSPGRIEAEGATLEMLAHGLSAQVGHTVANKSGLTGRYDYTLEWTPDNASPPPPGGPGGPGLPGKMDASNEATQVSLFTAIQEQLGLKLESEKGKVDVIVIDHIDQPSPN
ncbi:TIGR03435 family protein [Acidobacteria bacterium AB60]|nr:TIGR03435 family protein [Acidobacteria bacterium AB60]